MRVWIHLYSSVCFSPRHELKYATSMYLHNREGNHQSYQGQGGSERYLQDGAPKIAKLMVDSI
jgi:hypothetical protein